MILCIFSIILLCIYVIYLRRRIIKLQWKLDDIAYWLSNIDETELNHSLPDKRYLIEARKIVNLKNTDD